MSIKKEILMWTLLGASLIIGGLSLFKNEDPGPVELKKVAYVNTNKVFSEFEMKQELERKLETDLYSKKALVDSLMFQLTSLKNQLESEQEPSQKKIEEFYQLQAYYAKQKETYEQYQINETQKYDAQILGQMTQYINDYGKENAYDFIFGADNSGTVLYGDPIGDVTEEVLIFINEKYQGKS